MKNARFNPTANGNLHLGHLYLILLNYHTAKKNGGKFIVRFDDDQFYWVKKLGRERVNQICEEIKEDLAWLGIKVDLYSYESKEKKENHKYTKILKKLKFAVTDNYFDEKDFFIPQIKSMDRPYPYVPYLTAVKVVQDYREGCGVLIRGEDLVSEFSLYCHFCRLLNIPIPEFYYVPKLMQQNGNDLSDVSKTKGNFKIRDFREKGYTPKQVIKILKEACLINKTKGWDYMNLKKNPVIKI